MVPDEPAQPANDSRIAALRQRAADLLRFHPREVSVLAALGLLLVIGSGLAYARARPTAAVAPPTGAVPSGSTEASTPAATIIVDIVGAVRHPGVYDFAQGARVIDAVKAAGGFVRDADTQAVNLARPLVDGEQIIVPKEGEAPTGAAAGTTSNGSATQGGKVNINSATVADFDTLPGIGPVLAQKIVDYRDQHGPFSSVQDLMKVSGIGPKKFAELQDQITV
jgi:competence protein ComEA